MRVESKARIFLFAGLILLLQTQTRGQFSYLDVSDDAGLVKVSGASGIAVADYDQDGLEDLYVSYRTGPNRLYKNLGAFQFVEIARQTGVDFEGGTRSAIWLDVDNDSYPDLYLANVEKDDMIYQNKRDGTFVNVTPSTGIRNPANPFSVNTADVNHDGFVDIYVSNFDDENCLFMNQGGSWSFNNQVGPYGLLDDGKSMGSLFFDSDGDRDQDLYLVHDQNQPNLLYRNDALAFIEKSVESGLDVSSHGMGVDAGDINNDGLLDVYITNLHENRLLLNTGDGSYVDISASAGVQDRGMGWGTVMLDYDNDGWVDIYSCNDSKFSPYPNVLYRNKGDLTFEIVDIRGAVSSEGATYGCACADLDLDGRLDLVLANYGIDPPTQVLRNTTEPRNWIGFRLVDRSDNPIPVGAAIQIVDNRGILHFDQLHGGSGFATQNSSLLHFGLGDASGISLTNIYWPSGTEQRLEGLNQNQYYKVVEGTEPEMIKSQTTSVRDLHAISFSVYPIPAAADLFVQIDLIERAQVGMELFNMNGKLIYIYTNSFNPGEHVVKLENPGRRIQSGPGLLALRSGAHYSVTKVIFESN